jgi:transposase-like protein
MNQPNLFKWRHFQGEIILLCVRWYLRYPLSYRDIEEMMLDRGLKVDHSTINRWVQRYGPELDERCRKHLILVNDSYRVDETYVKVKGEWKYLYRAIDSKGNTIDFILSDKRDAKAAKKFFCKVLKASHVTSQRAINTDKNAAYPIAIEELKEEGLLSKDCKLRAVKYLNNIIEQDHRLLKRLIKPGLGFSSFDTAWRTLRGYEAMHMIRKGQVKGIGKRDIEGQVKFIERLFGLAA